MKLNHARRGPGSVIDSNVSCASVETVVFVSADAPFDVSDAQKARHLIGSIETITASLTSGNETLSW